MKGLIRTIRQGFLKLHEIACGPDWHFYDGDPMVRCLMKIPGIGPGSVFVAAIVIYIVVPAVWSFVNGTFHTMELGGRRLEGFLQPINANLLALPFLYAFIFNYYRNARGVIKHLVDRGVLKPEDRSGGNDSEDSGAILDTRTVRRVTYSCRSIFSSAILIFAAFVLAVYPIASGYTRDTFNWMFTGTGTRPLGVYFFIAFNGFGVYLMGGWALNHLRLSIGLRSLFRDKDAEERFKLATLHPDRCMGLGPVSDIAKSAALVLIAVSFWMFIWQTGAYVGMEGKSRSFLEEMFRIFSVGIGAHASEGARGFAWLAGWIAYLTLAPIVFFAPLSSLRDAMSRQKESDLSALSSELMKRDDTREFRKRRKVYRAMEKTKVWPFNIETMVSFMLSIMLPFVLTTLSEIIARRLGG